MDWRHRAICRDEDPELFFPVGTSGPALLQIAEAKTVCRRCPVIEQCRTWALDTGQAGVWGGTSEDERDAICRRNGEHRTQTATPRTPAERGRELLARGVAPDEVAHRLGRHVDTVRRWARPA